MNFKVILWTCFFFFPFSERASAIRILQMTVPEKAQEGDRVMLTCHFDLEGDSLYSLTWWLGSFQFFEFNPKWGQPQVYEFPGLDVEMKSSNASILVLRNISSASSGRYKCEVLSFPKYEKDSKHGYMKVFDSPLIKVISPNYEPDEVFEATCSVSDANSTIQFMWLLNHQRVPRRYYVSDEYTPNEVSLRLHWLDTYHRHGGTASLICTALVDGTFSLSSEIQLKLTGASHRLASCSPPSYWGCSSCFFGFLLLFYIHLCRK